MNQNGDLGPVSSDAKGTPKSPHAARTSHFSTPLVPSAADSAAFPFGDSDDSIRKWALKEIHRISRCILSDQPVELYLFGSWARGDVKRASDIDIAVLPTGPVDPIVFAQLRSALEESHVPYRVDVVDLNTTSDEFRRRVLDEGIRWPL